MEKTKIDSVYWTLLRHKGWNLHLAATDQGLCYVGSQDKPFAELEAWIAARFPLCSLTRDEERMRPYARELTEFLEGERMSFTLAHDLRGTPFQRAVWEALANIPYGATCSYSDIAARIHRPAAVRAVGAAIGANPVLISIPCHRVIGKSGALTGYRGGMDMKTRLLELEGESRTLNGAERR